MRRGFGWHGSIHRDEPIIRIPKPRERVRLSLSSPANNLKSLSWSTAFNNYILTLETNGWNDVVFGRCTTCVFGSGEKLWDVWLVIEVEVVSVEFFTLERQLKKILVSHFQSSPSRWLPGMTHSWQSSELLRSSNLCWPSKPHYQKSLLIRCYSPLRMETDPVYPCLPVNCHLDLNCGKVFVALVSDIKVSLFLSQPHLIEVVEYSH